MSCYPVIGLKTPEFIQGMKNRPIKLDQTVEKTFGFRSKMLYNIGIYGLGYATFSLTLIDPNHPFAGVA